MRVLTESEASTEDIVVSAFSGVLSVVLNRLAKRNALDHATHVRLDRIFDDFEADPSLSVAVISSACPSAFCSGQDLSEVASGTPLAFPKGGFAGLTSRRRTKPLIAAVNGPAHGGGFELAMACDVIVASRSAHFSLPEIRVGLAPLAGGIQRLVRAVGYHRAMAVMLLGQQVSAQQAQAWGIVAELVEGDPVPRASALAAELGRNSPLAIAAVIEAAQHGLTDPLSDSIDAAWKLDAVSELLASAHPVEGARAFLGRRAPDWSGR